MSQRILLIDDSPLQLRAREAVLRDAGFDVCTATTADGALALLRSGSVGNSIGTVVTDHVMPGVSGADFVKAIRKIRPQIPIIVITGLPEAESEYEGLHIEFRHKPCHPSDLIGLIRRSMSEAA
jgi:DNA-binding NtrC family response regulator